MGLMHFFPRTTATCLGFAFFPNAPQKYACIGKLLSKNLSAYALPSLKVNFQRVLSIPGIESSFQASFVINVPSQTLLFKLLAILKLTLKLMLFSYLKYMFSFVACTSSLGSPSSTSIFDSLFWATEKESGPLDRSFWTMIMMFSATVKTVAWHGD